MTIEEKIEKLEDENKAIKALLGKLAQDVSVLQGQLRQVGPQVPGQLSAYELQAIKQPGIFRGGKK